VRIHGEGQGEQNINPFTLMVLAPYENQVFGAHHCAFAETLQQLKLYRIKPMVTVRNLYDTVVSCKERIDMNGGHGSVLPPAYIPLEWNEWSDGDKLLWTAYNVGQWQLKFFVSWLEADVEKLWVKYEDFYADQRSGFKRIFDYYRLPHPHDSLIDAATSRTNINFNKGVSGRGASLPDGVKRILDAQAATWGRTNEPYIHKMLYA
jgi:hypothetical protein